MSSLFRSLVARNVANIPTLALLHHTFHYCKEKQTALACLCFCTFFTYSSIGEGGVERDPTEAAKLFSELAEQGHPFAQVKTIDYVNMQLLW